MLDDRGDRDADDQERYVKRGGYPAAYEEEQDDRCDVERSGQRAEEEDPLPQSKFRIDHHVDRSEDCDEDCPSVVDPKDVF